jgi:NAD(P) transhydrogenase subunit beta
MFAFADVLFIIVNILFILALKGLSSASTSQKGNLFGMTGMLIAIVIPLLSAITTSSSYFYYALLAIVCGSGIGYSIAKKVPMISLPQLIAAFHSLIGLAAVCIAISVYLTPHIHNIQCISDLFPISNALEMSIGVAIGAITFTGSVVAFGKLQGLIRKSLIFKCQHKLNLAIVLCLIIIIVYFVIYQEFFLFMSIVLLALVLGYLLVMPIGGADMPVIVSMLNSYSGWTAAGIGFTLNNNVLVIVGALVGSSGAVLSYVMCKGMNRSLFNVIVGKMGEEAGIQTSSSHELKTNVNICGIDDAAFILKNANSIIIVPGYGMAVTHAQHAIKELVDVLKDDDIAVRFAIHPVAGRMPGHMNVLLAEANISPDDVLELEEINHDFSHTDVAVVVGANDITNPSAKHDPTSPIYGMPVLDVDKARTVLVIKRSLASGYAGIDNPLFYQNNTLMVLGDAKKVCEGILTSIKEL